MSPTSPASATSLASAVEVVLLLAPPTTPPIRQNPSARVSFDSACNRAATPLRVTALTISRVLPLCCHLLLYSSLR
ncbi:hypothetical protein VNO80_10530 [Phaseolus coccineus]|uniref:Secreted protein n=1 Tax=Phaseolus coccineus TaxID=3886 RepID=A0AAN9N8B4_PHACN